MQNIVLGNDGELALLKFVYCKIIIIKKNLLRV